MDIITDGNLQPLEIKTAESLEANRRLEDDPPGGIGDRGLQDIPQQNASTGASKDKKRLSKKAKILIGVFSGFFGLLVLAGLAVGGYFLYARFKP